MRTKLTIIAMLLLSAAAAAAAAAETPAESAYAHLLTLAGRWETVTQTVFHLDGTRLLLTHYCAQGNQPRLAATLPDSTDRLGFTYLDATNLAGPDASHLVACDFVFEDADHFVLTETYHGSGGDDATTRRFTRMPAAP